MYSGKLNSRCQMTTGQCFQTVYRPRVNMIGPEGGEYMRGVGERERGSTGVWDGGGVGATGA